MEDYLVRVRTRIIEDIEKSETTILNHEDLNRLLRYRYEKERVRSSTMYFMTLRCYFENLVVFILNNVGVTPISKESAIKLVSSFSV